MLGVLQQRENDFTSFRVATGAEEGIRTSAASLCEVSGELKQDGGSSRGSGEGVGIVVPRATSGRVEHKHNTEPLRHLSEGLILVSSLFNHIILLKQPPFW